MELILQNDIKQDRKQTELDSDLAYPVGKGYTHSEPTEARTRSYFMQMSQMRSHRISLKLVQP